MSDLQKGNTNGFKKGMIPWNRGLTKETDERVKRYSKKILGYHHTEEIKEKLREKTLEQFKKKGHPMLGKHHTEETKEKIKLAKQKNPTRFWLGKTRKFTKEWIKNCLRRRTPSSLELKMIDIIQKYNLPYKFVGNGKFFIERKNPDFINCNGEKIAIEVFYKEHKNLFGNLEKWKYERQGIFNRYGWKLLFFDETEVNEENIIKKLRGDSNYL